MMSAEERAAWLEERKKYLTASDVAPLFGASPFKSYNQLFREKVQGVAADIDGLAHVEAGQFYEEGTLLWHMANRGLTAREDECPWKKGLVVHPTCQVLAATPDAVTRDGADLPWVTEAKFTGADKAHKTWRKGRTPVAVFTKGSKTTIPDRLALRAPEHYWMQLQVQMACLGITRGRIVVSFGQARADLDFDLDLTFIEGQVIPKTEEFWARVVAARELQGLE